MGAKYDPCCGIDVHKDLLAACVRRGDEEEVRTFGTTTTQIHELASWIRQNGCVLTTMESTGSYWIPVWNVFEEEEIPVRLANAQFVKAIPGRKTDTKDAQWLAELTQEGHVPASYVPPARLRRIRALLTDLDCCKRDRTRLINRKQKIMETANLKLSSVVSDIRGKSAQYLLKWTLQNGAPSADDIRDMRAKKKISRRLHASPEELSEALNGIIAPEVRFEFEKCQELIDFYDKTIAETWEYVTTLYTEHEKAGARMLTQIPGIGLESAYIIVGILGDDMSVFPSADHLCSWAGVAPGNNESAGKRKSGKTTKGHALLKRLLVVCANSAVRAKNTFFAARHKRLLVRKGYKKAIMAIAHSMLKVIYTMLSTGEAYEERGDNYYETRERERQFNAAVSKLTKLGVDASELTLPDEPFTVVVT